MQTNGTMGPPILGQLGSTGQVSVRNRPKYAQQQLTENSITESEKKVSMPIRGKGVAITDKLNEMNVRRDRIEMMNYQQKLAGQQQSINMLMEEERVVNEANQAAKLSAELAHWQLQKKAQISIAMSESRDGMFFNKKRTEPLITKAYNAFRHQTTNK